MCGSFFLALEKLQICTIKKIMNNKISCVWMILFFIGFAFYNLSALQASHQPTAVVIGTVLCDACYQQDLFSISGAIVAVECANSDKKSRFYQEVKTNEHGKFSVHLPFSVNKHVKHIIDGCLVRLINSGEPHCAVASTTSASSSFRLHSRKKGTHIFSAGFFNLLCNQKPSIHSTTKEALYPHKSLTSSTPDDHTFSPPLSSFLTTKQEFLPPLPRLPPLPELPPLPSLPTLPLLPPIFHSPSIFSPIFQSPPMSPPSIFPPFFRSPPIFPPILPPPVIGLTPPPIPRLTPLPPPPPPPPTFPFPVFPPFPFRPMPGFPGVPPASTSKNSP